MTKSNPLSSARIKAQLKYDLIGKDSYRGITLSYAYLANQTGHFALAFVPAAGIFLLLHHCWPGISYPGLWAGIGMALAWIGFEVYNISEQLKEGKGNDGKYVFPPDNSNIIQDTLIDMGFFTVGGLSFAAGSTLELKWFFLLPVIIFIALLYISRTWYITKICQQTANYPFQLRLSQWNHPIEKNVRDKVLQFHIQSNLGQHILLMGPANSGKTPLAVALANEKSIQRFSCLYTTGTKLLTLLYETDEAILKEDEYALCTWRTADYLVIDDINPGDPIRNETITADLFAQHLNANPTNAAAIKNGNIIWVLGNGADADLKNNWKDFLLTIGVANENIHLVQLGN